ncbi:MAG: phosphatidate cytidylyltransferase, partial [Proteobacteria bacterium]|nr:phosphatidate cytidylyltransferase [Pseudomonadota bacterium]
IGGPRLAPRVSPNKTWAGLAGGVLGAAVVGGIGAGIAGQAQPLLWAAGAAGLGALEQGGDLLESAMKRHFGRKDSSGLIPGHGGLMDRVDGLWPAALALWIARTVLP